MQVADRAKKLLELYSKIIFKNEVKIESLPLCNFTNRWCIFQRNQDLTGRHRQAPGERQASGFSLAKL